MHRDTVLRARTIVKREEVILEDFLPPFYYHFKVKQREGVWTDVWYSKVRGFQK